MLSLLAFQLLKPRHDVCPFKFCFENPTFRHYTEYTLNKYQNEELMRKAFADAGGAAASADVIEACLNFSTACAPLYPVGAVQARP